MRIALVLGSAACLWDDVHAARRLLIAAGDPRDVVVVACNDAGVEWPSRLDHWVTLHPGQMAARVARRRGRGQPDAGCLWTYEGARAVEGLVWNTITSRDGSTGFLAVRVAAAVGADRTILCGVPMTPTPHIPGVSRDRWGGGDWGEAESFRAAWERDAHDVMVSVRSLSGWTADLLCRPTVEWLREVRSCAA